MPPGSTGAGRSDHPRTARCPRSGPWEDSFRQRAGETVNGYYGTDGIRIFSALVLDTGALIAVDRRDRQVGALLRVAQREGIAVRTSAGVVAQAWRDGARQANLARTLAGIDIAAIDQASGRRIGRLLARSGSGDIVDGHVALLVAADDIVLHQRDPDDIHRLLDARNVSATLSRV